MTVRHSSGHARPLLLHTLLGVLCTAAMIVASCGRSAPATEAPFALVATWAPTSDEAAACGLPSPGASADCTAAPGDAVALRPEAEVDATIAPLWLVHSDPAEGISFDYWCTLSTEDNLLRFADDTYLEVLPANGHTLDELVTEYLAQLGSPQYVNRDDSLLEHEPPGVTLSTVVSNSWHLTTLFLDEDTVYRFGALMQPLTSCDAQALGVSNPDAYYRTVDSFSVTD